MRMQKFLVLSSLLLVIGGCGKTTTGEESKDKQDKIAIESKVKDEAKGLKSKASESPKVTKADSKKEEKADSKKEEKTSDIKSTSKESAKEADKAKVATAVKTSGQSKTSTQSTTQPKTATQPVAPPVVQPKPVTQPVTQPKPVAPPVVQPKPVAPPVVQPKPVVLEKLSLAMLEKFNQRSSSLTGVDEGQINPRRTSENTYGDTPVTSNALLIISTGRASVSELSSTFVGKTDGKYKVTGLYVYTTTVPYLQEAYPTDVWNKGTYFYDGAKQNGLFNKSFSGVRFDKVRATINQNNLEGGLKLTRLVITFGQL